MSEKDKILFQIKELTKVFNLGRQRMLKAVDSLSFEMMEGETLGLVGESGCGKTTCGRAVAGMIKPSSGEILYEGRDIQGLEPEAQRKFRRECQYIFQDPYASLDPRMMIGDIVAEGMDLYENYSRDGREQRIAELLAMVGLNEEHKLRYPHELSGGQRQRVGIARCLAVKPRFIVCDEPISALDVSIQAQVVNLLKRFQKEMNLTYLFISHDLSMIRYISRRIAVMYLGSMVELAPSAELWQRPLHPYTQALMAAIPVPNPSGRRRLRVSLEGEVPSAINLPPGCKFAARCPYAAAECRREAPTLRERSPGHFVACHFR